MNLKGEEFSHMISEYDIAGIGRVSKESGLVPLSLSSDGFSQTGKNGIRSITATGDGKVEFIDNGECVLAYVKSAMGYPAYYPLPEARIKRPVKAVLMDLDGTSVRSEDFWMWIIQLSMADLLADPDFQLEDEDIPYISGHSVSEHLQYCIDKYCADLSLLDAWQFYRENTTRELSEISHGRGRQDAFPPAEGLADFLLELKGMGTCFNLAFFFIPFQARFGARSGKVILTDCETGAQSCNNILELP